MISWYSEQEILPWQQSFEPYEVWISEIMLQQTTVAVIRYRYKQWMDTFPDITCLAKASLQDVSRVFEGLGYYARLRNLYQTAQYIVHAGFWPSDYKLLKQLPGIGNYTAKVILSRCFDQYVLAFDVNIKRFFSRIFLHYPLTQTDENHFENLLKNYLIMYRPSVLGQAFLRFSQTICKKKNPLCSKCYFVSLCQAYRQGKVENLFPKKNVKYIKRENYVLVIVYQGLFIVEHRDEGIGKGMCSFPRCSRDDFDKILTAQNVGKVLQLPQKVHYYTHYREYLFPYICLFKEYPSHFLSKNYEFYSKDYLQCLPFLTVYRDIVNEALLNLEDKQGEFSHG